MGINNNIRNDLSELAAIAKEPTAKKPELVVNYMKSGLLGRFFLSRAVCSEWDSIFQENSEIGLFDDDLQQAYISYLLRIYKDSPEQLLHSISLHLKELTRHNLFRILSFANEQNAEIAIQFIDLANRLAEEPDDIYGSTLCEYIVKITEVDETWPQAASLIFEILRFEFNNSKGYRDYQPKLDNHAFEEFLEGGLKEITSKRPIEALDLILKTLDDLIKLKIEQGNNSPASTDEIHCQRVEASTSGYADPEELLVIGLTRTAIQILDEHPEWAPKINQRFEELNWNITKRIRAYLCSQKPKLFSELIREWIPHNLTKIAKGDISREEKFMLNKASEEFKETLFSEGQRSELFEAIIHGPDATWYIKRLREHSPNEDHAKLVLKYKKDCRMRSLSLFKDSLFGEHAEYLHALKDELGDIKTVWEEDRERAAEAQVHSVETRSPISEEDLSALSDGDLIDYLNTWNQGGRNSDRFHVDITTGALASTFQKVIERESDRFNPERFNWKLIENSEYHGAAINAAKKLHSDDQLPALDNWLDLMAWMLEREYEQFSSSGAHYTEEERKQSADPWSHNAILSFIRSLINKENTTDIRMRSRIGSLLSQLCTTTQSSLENYELDTDDPTRVHSTAINRTRSNAIGELPNFAFWIHRAIDKDGDQPSEDSTTELRSILEQRFKDGPTMSPPELSILSVDLSRVSYLNREWLNQYIEVIFPDDNLVWSKVFASHILYSKCLGWLYELTKGLYARACDNLNLFRYKERNSEQVVAQLGTHIFLLYLWSKFELPSESTNDDNLITLFYLNATDEEKCRTFSKITHMLGTQSELEKEVIDRCVAFIEYRFNEADPAELDGFDHLLRSKNFNKVWLLEKYAQLLDYKPTDGSFRSYELDSFFGALDDEPEAAAKCFEKLTQRASTQDRFYLHSKDGKKFLRLLLKHENPEVVKLGELAQANLLNAEMFEYLEL